MINNSINKKSAMKKIVLTLVMFVCLIANAMVLSSFVVPKQENTQIKASGDNWKKFRENVPYCDADGKSCVGYGIVWVNTDTYQIAFSIDGYSTKYDLSEYTGCDGYNMRFWHKGNSKYYYVNIFIPKSAFY